MSANKISSFKKLSARKKYEAGAAFADIAKYLGLSEPAFRARRLAWDWPPRVKTKRGTSDAAPTLPGDFEQALPAPPAEPTELLQNLESAIQQEIPKARAQLSRALKPPRNAEDVERAARAYSALVKTLAQAKNLDGSAHDDAERAAAGSSRSVDELRDELARRIQKIRDAEESG